MGQATDGNARQLEDAFQLFTQMSSQLEASYRVLENRVAQLSEELAAARSERLRQLAEKERLANRLERLLDLLPGGVVVVDGSGVVSESNPAAVDLLGEPLDGVRWHSIIERAFEPHSEDGREVTLRTGRRVSLSTQSLEPEPGCIVLLLDVTEQHRLREMVDRHRRLSAMGEMAASLAHQVRTPLASALLYVSHLDRKDLPAADRDRFTHKVVGRLRHLERMVNDMLQFARGGSFDMEDMSVSQLVEELQHTLEPQLAACAGTLEIRDRCQGMLLRGNREALQSALLNLATNALQACMDGARLTLDIVPEAGGGDVVFLVRDNGSGIDPSIHDQLFTPFFTTRPDGTGLGLPVVRAIALAHQGDAWLQDSGPNGSTFAVRVPAAGQRDAVPSGAPSAPEPEPPLLRLQA